MEISTDNQVIPTFYIDKGEGTPLLYLHGWGCDHSIFYPMMESLDDVGRQIALDFPGFGETPLPKGVWGSAEYSEFTHQFIMKMKLERVVLICHSFGGRVAIQLAEKYPALIAGMILISSAGLKRKMPWKRWMKVKLIRTATRLAERMIPGGLGKQMKERLYNMIASKDYQNAGELKKILIKVVNEDLSDRLPNITIPALLLYGDEDTETPPAVGKKIHSLLPNALYVELKGFNHLSILDLGRHQVGYQVRQFIKGLSL